MTPHETPKRNVLGEWLHRADRDIELAAHLLQESAPYTAAIAFHCQQAAEKYLKALLISWEIPFPKTHDIKALLNLIARKNATLAGSLQDAVVLTPYGVAARYPGDLPDPDENEAQEALALAEKVRGAVMRALPSF